MMEEDGPRRPQRFAPLPLDALGIADLTAYIAELRAEIARAEAAIAQRQDHRSAADAVFRRPSE